MANSDSIDPPRPASDSGAPADSPGPALQAHVAELESTIQKLTQSEARMQAIIQSMADGIAVADPNGRLVMFNRAAEEVLGVKVTDSGKEEWSELYGLYRLDGVTPFPPNELPLACALRGEYSHDVEMLVHNPNLDAPILIRVRGTPVIDKCNVNHGGVATFRDITEERRQEQLAATWTKELEIQIEQRTSQLREKEQQTRLLLNSTAEAIYGLDLEGNCTFVNPACVRLLRYESAEQLIGRNMHNLIHHHHADGTAYLERECRIYQAVQQGHGTHFDDEVLWRADGTSFPAEFWSHPVVRNGEITGSVVTFLDISERRFAEQEAQRHRAELAHVVRLATMGEIATGLAHELNQPLAAIKNYASGMLLRVRAGTSEIGSIVHVLEQVAMESVRAAGIIRSLRRFVSKTDPAPVKVSLNDLVGSVADILSVETRRRNCELILELRDELLEVIAEPIQIEQVLVNLIHNGMDAMSACPPSERRIEVRTDLQDSCVYVAVRDAGVGLSRKEMDQVFQPFYSTKSAGLGMGLPISRTIIEAYGGQLWVTRNEDAGATFHFSLPRAGNSHGGSLDPAF
ncbi:MAG: PAS domain S-box-containing protein [Pirellulaceae bacterium]|jgi:PAS domain S-box-containing protein